MEDYYSKTKSLATHKKFYLEDVIEKCPIHNTNPKIT